MTQKFTRRGNLSLERYELLSKLVEKNVAISNLQKVHGFNHKTVRKYFPEYRLRKEASNRPDGKRVRDIVKENQELVDSMLNEEAPGVAIAAALDISRNSLFENYPEYFWSREQVASFGGVMRYLNMMDGPYKP